MALAASAEFRAFVRATAQAHARLPVMLRVWLLAPAVLLFTIVSGLLFTLPPGPLCDEGMVLFMEGGCDWGDSNIFFFSKLCLLMTLNVVFVILWFRAHVRPVAFVPHLVLLLVVATVFDTDFRCGNYYGHPNGTTGQMIVEAVAFIVMGLAFTLYRDGRWAALLVIVLVWNALHVAVFYAGLAFTPHWTWLHTWWIAAALCSMAEALRRLRRRVNWNGLEAFAAGERRRYCAKISTRSGPSCFAALACAAGRSKARI